METIGLIAAMAQEREALLRLITTSKRMVLGRFRGVSFRLADRHCLLITSGIGLKRAEEATRALLTMTGPQLLVSFGIAGALSDDLQLGDVVIASHACLLDRGLTGAPWPLADLSKAARKAAAQALRPDDARLVHGTALTTRGSQVVLQPAYEMPHPILEMETAGIAQVAAEMGVPLLSIRSVSDGPQSPIPFDLAAILDEDCNLRIGRALMMVLRRPQLILQSRQMLQNSRKAADHAAWALIAALSQPLPLITP